MDTPGRSTQETETNSAVFDKLRMHNPDSRDGFSVEVQCSGKVSTGQALYTVGFESVLHSSSEYGDNYFKLAGGFTQRAWEEFISICKDTPHVVTYLWAQLHNRECARHGRHIPFSEWWTLEGVVLSDVFNKCEFQPWTFKYCVRGDAFWNQKILPYVLIRPME